MGLPWSSDLGLVPWCPSRVQEHWTAGLSLSEGDRSIWGPLKGCVETAVSCEHEAGRIWLLSLVPHQLGRADGSRTDGVPEEASKQ